jgi:AraC family carnitine catabolism transcriptional activator
MSVLDPVAQEAIPHVVELPSRSVTTDKVPIKFGFLVAANVSLLSVLLIYEPLRAANRFSGKTLFDVRFLSTDGEAVATSNGFAIPVNGTVADANELDVVVLAASYRLPDEQKRALLGSIKRLGRHGTTIWGIDHGVMLLAEEGLIGERKATAHPSQYPSFQEHWPDLEMSEELFVADGNLATCGGHTASLDMTLAYIVEQFGEPLARAIADEMMLCMKRTPQSSLMPISVSEPWRAQPVLCDAVAIMRDNIEVPVQISSIAERVGVSRRQLEYLARRYFGETPQQRYLRIRLDRGRRLLLNSKLSVTEIALACGFASGSGFSRSFHRQLSCTPSDYRDRYIREFALAYVSVD